MLLILGGAYCGKRKYVKGRIPNHSLISAYENHSWENWEEKWKENTHLVMEGWEHWIEKKLEAENGMQECVKLFKDFINVLVEEENRRGSKVAFIMLEMGRGIVPLSKRDRDLRDISGWITQYAAKNAEEVIYIWHGLAKQISLKGAR